MLPIYNIAGIGMNKKFLAIILILTVVVVAFAGCEEEKSGSKEPEMTVKEKSLPPQSGWLDSPESVEAATTQVQGTINETNLVFVQIKVTFQDSDAEHAETDDGSEPDELELSVTGKFETGAQIKEKASGKSDTSGNGYFELTVPSENVTQAGQSQLITSLEYTLKGKSFGGGKNPTGPGGIIPIPFLIYIDQGAAYTMEISYKYLTPEGGEEE
jgi:hypothetical protein